MRHFKLTTLAVLAMLMFTASIAMAAVTWHSGPTFTRNAGLDGLLNTADDTFTATGDGSGFGNQPAVATITITGTARYTCVNKGGNAAPGQNPVPGTSTETADLGNADHNGRGSFDLTAGPYAPAATVSGKTAGCPNKNWMGINPVVEGPVSATLTITQGSRIIYTDTTPE